MKLLGLLLDSCQHGAKARSAECSGDFLLLLIPELLGLYELSSSVSGPSISLSIALYWVDSLVVRLP